MAKHLPKAVIWDLDGTLSDDRARAHFVEVEKGKKRDWKSYFDAIGEDPPIAASMEVLRAMHAAGNRVVFLTGRPDHTRRTTERWLKANGLTEYDRLVMRPPRDFRPSGAFKVDEVAKLRREFELVCAFEDRIDVADALRDAGVPVFLYGAGAMAAAEALEVLDADQGELVDRKQDREQQRPAAARKPTPKAAAQVSRERTTGKRTPPKMRSAASGKAGRKTASRAKRRVEK
ncbi:MAG TPA: HAD family acid phosphatase [Longimicrobium sp.]|jgi:phosphoglycolate phosphatase-like HAD superfamily hydrolase